MVTIADDDSNLHGIGHFFRIPVRPAIRVKRSKISMVDSPSLTVGVHTFLIHELNQYTHRLFVASIVLTATVSMVVVTAAISIPAVTLITAAIVWAVAVKAATARRSRRTRRRRRARQR